MKDELKLLFLILVLIVPYLLLLYKNISIRIRLLFISLIEIFALCIMIIIVFFGNGILVETTYFYSLFVSASVFLNFIIIFVTWLIEKINLCANKSKI
ncbi:MAG: hypothetical protein JWP45_3433 [Mucilaginibacter sp.]|nr:hypothetical protein [Mucilaginibacter sp.]MDB5140204.1 hypothetical protein [Mucilaginibacter sp.]